MNVHTEAERQYRRMIGRRVRTKRVWLELSQDEVAAKAEVTRNFVSAIERGSQGLDLFRLRLLARALDLEITQLISDDPTWHL